MSVTDLAARIHRLDQLARSLARELSQMQKSNDPLLYIERREYLKSIRAARSGIEAARVVLVRARQRLTRKD